MEKQRENGQKSEAVTVQKRYKDTMFRMLFKEKKNLLSLYNAVNGTAYTDAGDIEINTLENAIYMAMKNDVSCVFDMTLNLYEHQSTVNMNMPLRSLFYVAQMYEKMIPMDKLYSRKQIMLPTPRFIVFYNGEESQPERRVLRLSDAYKTDEEETNLELVVVQLNINDGFNTELKECCQILKEYMQYVGKVRIYKKQMTIEQAVEKAVTECIEEGILKEFLLENRKEVISMSIFEYNEELHKKVIREEAYEDGYEEGYGNGYGKGSENEKQKFISNMLKDNLSPELVSKYTETTIEYVYQVQQEMLQCFGEEKIPYHEDEGKE